jgi:hypothetical protein
MVRRALAGLVGAALGLLPLLLLSVLMSDPARSGTAAPSNSQVVQAGATALIGGLLLGGGVAGWIAGRKAGVAGGTAAGIVAAVFYAATLIGGIFFGGVRGKDGLYYVGLHPLRSSAAILMVASVIIVVSVLASLVVRPAGRVGPQPAAAPMASYGRPPSPRYVPQPPYAGGSAAWPPSQPRSREQISVPRTRQSQSRPRYPR